MADLIAFTASPIQVTDAQFGPAGTIVQSLTEALDIGAYDQLDLVLTIQSVTSAGGTPNVTVEVWTGMQSQTEDGWVQLLSFGVVGAVNTPQKAAITPWYGPLRYVRWVITALGGTGTRTASFTLEGLARKGRRFAPATLPGLQLWLAADSLGLADGDQVGLWRDLSGNNHHAVQATAGTTPTFLANVQNGLPVVRFDGVDDYMETVGGAATGNAPHTLIVATSLATYNLRGVICYGTQGTGNCTSTIGTINTAAWYGGQNRIVPTGAPTLSGGFEIFSKTFDGTTITGFVNGATDATGTLTYAIGNTAIGLGVYYDNLGFQYANLGEVLVYNRALSTDERQRVESWLRHKWGTP